MNLSLFIPIALTTIFLVSTHAPFTQAFSGVTPPQTISTTATEPIDQATSITATRRQTFANVASFFGNMAASVIVLPQLKPDMANAMPSDETPKITTRMGGLLERYQDVNFGLSLMVPSGWNKFEGEVGAYNIKWQDLVTQEENIKISSSPVRSNTTSIAALGEDVQALGGSLAERRNAKLVSASERFTDGVLYYEFNFAIKDGTHQLLSLSVNKGKVWSLDANCKENRYSKREEMYKNIIGSFAPKLN